MERKPLLKSQQELILIKKAELMKQEAIVNHMNQTLLGTIFSIAGELGILENEFDQWLLNETSEYFDRINEKK